MLSRRKQTRDPLAARYDTAQPWIWWWFLSSDFETRLTGRSRVLIGCAVCGQEERLALRIPRFGSVPAPAGGRHPERLRFMAAHAHPDRGHPMSWARPLLNPAVFDGELPLDLLAMRLAADQQDADPQDQVSS